jgi:hypothetical protein
MDVDHRWLGGLGSTAGDGPEPDPGGQLDGGHVVYTLRANVLASFTVDPVALVLLGFVWSGWCGRR